MTDEFLTKGLQNDRYLKALRLADQFEDEIEAVLFELDQRMVDVQPGLFDLNTSADFKTNRTTSSALTTHRINHSMTGPMAPESDQTQKLNVHLYWMPPTEYNRTDIDGALRAFGYKIKYADEDVDGRVAEQTRTGDWPLETSSNPYDSNIAFYKHVSSVAEMEETADVLVKHFREFGDAYAVHSEEKS
jgi:hypothetical protein